ncbi:hypothetical protein Q8F55_008279 [Vanrija albida]|uniref:Uncharacterized protein n=1 Tax=Vanrija albida TaxID=181172 RepID=A0ABR3PVY2_9TREE
MPPAPSPAASKPFRPPPPPRPSFLRRLLGKADEPDMYAYYDNLYRQRAPSPSPSAPSASTSDAGPSRPPTPPLPAWTSPAWYYASQGMQARRLPTGTGDDDLPATLRARPGETVNLGARRPATSRPSTTPARAPPTQPDPYVMSLMPSTRPAHYHALPAAERKWIDWNIAQQKKYLAAKKKAEVAAAKQAKKVAEAQEKAAQRAADAERKHAERADAERARNYQCVASGWLADDRKWINYQRWARTHGFLPPEGERKEKKKAAPKPPEQEERYCFMLQPTDEFGVFVPAGAGAGGTQWVPMSRTMHMALTGSGQQQPRPAPAGQLWTL